MAITLSRSEFSRQFNSTLTASEYVVHPKYSVFTQYDGKRYYEPMRLEFERKYRCFAAVTAVLQPDHIVELGTHAASGAHAYLYGAPNAKYSGYDLFGQGTREDTKKPWLPYDISLELLSEIGADFKLYKRDLRDVKQLPVADFVAVDAAHDFQNEYQDMKLALTAKPQYVWVDDRKGAEVTEAIQQWVDEVQPEWVYEVEYCDGGWLAKL